MDTDCYRESGEDECPASGGECLACMLGLSGLELRMFAGFVDQQREAMLAAGLSRSTVNSIIGSLLDP